MDYFAQKVLAHLKADGITNPTDAELFAYTIKEKIREDRLRLGIPHPDHMDLFFKFILVPIFAGVCFMVFSAWYYTTDWTWKGLLAPLVQNW